MSFVNESLKSESLLQTTSFRTVRSYMTDSTHDLDSSSSYLQVIGIDSTTEAFRLPDARQLDTGHMYYVANDSTRTVKMLDFDGTSLVTLGAKSRSIVALGDNTSSKGHWFYESSASVTFASYSIYGFYGGNARAGRLLQIYPSTPSNDVPYIVVSPQAIVAVTLVSSSPSTGSVGVYYYNNLTTPIVSATLPNSTEVIIDNIFYPLSKGSKLAMMVNTGSTSILRPCMTIYFAGI